MVEGWCACGRGWYADRKCSANCRRPMGPGHRRHPDHRRKHRSRSRDRDRRRERHPPPPPQPTTTGEIPDTCVVCLLERPSAILQPCRHAVMCRRCIGVLLATEADPPGALCPVCRMRVEGFRRLTEQTLKWAIVQWPLVLRSYKARMRNSKALVGPSRTLSVIARAWATRVLRL